MNEETNRDILIAIERPIPITEPIPGPAVEQVAEPIIDQAADPIIDQVAEPIVDPTPAEPIVDAVPENMPVDIGSIPGVKEVYINESARPVKKAKNEITESVKNYIRATLRGGFINELVRKYNLAGIDIEKEAQLILEKKSNLSRSRREAVITLVNIRKQQQNLLKLIGRDMLNKENPSDEDLRKLLDEVEDASTNTQEVAQAVAKDIAQRSVNQIMEDAKVEYTPGEGGNDEVTTKALHDAVKNHGRTKFRGVFSSLDLVEDPQVGDVVRTIVPDDKGNHSGEELVYTYLGPNNWKLEGSYIQEELPGEPTRFRGVFSDYREVENPQAGDVCHVIVASKRPENIQYEDVFVYDGNKWTFSGQVEVSIPPENDEKEPVKEEDSSIPTFPIIPTIANKINRTAF